MTDSSPIEIKLVTTNVLTRWPCDVCGGHTEKVEVLAESHDGLRVCERCLKAGNIDERLEKFAAGLERCAANTRALIGRLRVPSFAEYTNFSERADVATHASYWIGSCHGDYSDEAETAYNRVFTDDAYFAEWRQRLAEAKERERLAEVERECFMAQNRDAGQEHDGADLPPF